MINCLFATAIVFYILVPCVLSFSQKKHQIKVEEHLRSGNTRKFLLWSTLIHYFFSDIKLVKKKKMTAWVIQIPFFFQGQISQTTSFCIFLDLVSCPVSPDCACVSSVIPYQCRDGISVTFSTGSWMPGGGFIFPATQDISAVLWRDGGNCGCEPCSSAPFPLMWPFDFKI